MQALSFLKEELPKIDSQVSQKITSFVFKKADFHLSDLLPFCASEEVFFFESKEEDFSFLGLGKSREIDIDDVPSIFKGELLEDILVYQDTFEQIRPPLFYLPEWNFVKRGGALHLRIHKSQELALFSTSSLLFNLSVWESFLSPWTSYEERPESDEWAQMIASSNRLFEKKELEKIVLSRRKIFSYDEVIEFPVMFRELYLGNKNSSHFSIFHQLNFNEAFISFTPERLFTLKGRSLETISLAGSTPRGSDEKKDRDLEIELESSDKLIREHAIVTTSIKEKLEDVTTKIEISPLVTMKLPYIQHRQATIKAEIKKDVSPVDLIHALHPTPAVGGIPQELAREHILEIEKSPRDFYAAPVGVISKDFSEIAVGIRSGLASGSTLTVYGGAGIVEGSMAEDEWMETGIKMQPFIKVINKSTI